MPLKNLSITLLFRVSGAVFQILLAFFVTIAFSEKDAAKFFIFYSLSNLIMIALKYGLDSYIYRKLSPLVKKNSKFTKIFIKNCKGLLTYSLAIYIVTLFVFSMVIGWHSEEFFVSALLLLLFPPSLAILTVNSSILRSSKLELFSVLSEPSTAIALSLLINYLIYVFGKGTYFNLVVVHGFSIFLWAAISEIMTNFHLNIKGNGKFKSKYLFKSIYLRNSLKSNLYTYLINWYPLYALGFFSDSRSVSMFNLANRISQVIPFFQNILNTVFSPEISVCLYEKNKKKLKEILYLNIALNIGFSVLFCAFLLGIDTILKTNSMLNVVEISSALLILIAAHTINSSLAISARTLILSGLLSSVNRDVLFRSFLLCVLFASVLVHPYSEVGASLAILITLLYSSLIRVKIFFDFTKK